MSQLSKMLVDMIDSACFNENFKNRLRDAYIYNYKTHRDIWVEDKNAKNKPIPKNTLSDSKSRLEGILAQYLLDMRQTDRSLMTGYNGLEKFELNNFVLPDIENNPFYLLYNYCFQNADFAAWYISLLIMLSKKVSVRTGKLKEFIRRFIDKSGFSFLWSQTHDETILLDALEAAKNTGSRDVKRILFLMDGMGLKFDEELNTIRHKKPTKNSLNRAMYGCGFVRFRNNNKRFERLYPLGILKRSESEKNNHPELGGASLSDIRNEITESYTKEQKRDFFMRTQECFDLFNGIYPLSEVAAYLSYRKKECFNIIINKNRYLKRSLCDYNIIDLLYAMKHKKWLYITYRNAINQQYQSILAYPLELRESTVDGRQYISFYTPSMRSVSCLRVESIDKLEIGDYVCEHPQDIERAAAACKLTWGNSFPDFVNENVKSDMPLHEVFFVITKNDPKMCKMIKADRRIQEYRETDDTIECRTKVTESSEMTPWLYSLLPELIKYEIDGTSYIKYLHRRANIHYKLYTEPHTPPKAEAPDPSYTVRIETKKGSIFDTYCAQRNRWQSVSATEHIKTYERKGNSDVIKADLADYFDEYGDSEILSMSEIKPSGEKVPLSIDALRINESLRCNDFLYIEVMLHVQRDSYADKAFSNIDSLIKLDQKSRSYVEYKGIMHYNEFIMHYMQNKDSIIRVFVNGDEKNTDLTDKSVENKYLIMADKKPTGFMPCKTHELLFNEIYGNGYMCMGELAYEILRCGDIAEPLHTAKSEIDSIFREVSDKSKFPKDAADYKIMQRAVDIFKNYSVDTVSPRGFETLGKTLRDIADFIKAVGNYDDESKSFSPLIEIDPSVESFYDLMPLTTVEKQWLNTLTYDEKAKFILTDDELQKLRKATETEHCLFDVSNVNCYDRWCSRDKNDKNDVLATLLRALNAQQTVTIKLLDENEEKAYRIAGSKLEYNNHTDSFVLYGVRYERYMSALQNGDVSVLCSSENAKSAFITQDVNDIISAEINAEKFDIEEVKALVRCNIGDIQHKLILKFKDTKNVPDRVLNRLESFPKNCTREKRGLSSIYTLTVHYNKEDTYTLANTILSYGEFLYVYSDDGGVLDMLLGMLQKSCEREPG